MRVWKDRVRYDYPACQTITFQSAEGSPRFRLKQVISAVGVHARYVDSGGNSCPCEFVPFDGFYYALNVLPKPRTPIRKQLYGLSYGDFNAIIPLLNRSGDVNRLTEILPVIAKLCEMTPTSDVMKLRIFKEIPDGQDCSTQAPARVEAGGQTEARSNLEVVQEQQDRPVREQEPTPPAVQPPRATGIDPAYTCTARCGVSPCAICESPNPPNCRDSRCRLCSVILNSPPASPAYTVAS